MFRNEDLSMLFQQVDIWWESHLDPLKQQNVSRFKIVRFLIDIGVINEEREFEGLYFGISQNWDSRVSHEMFIRRSDFTRLMYLAIMRAVLARTKKLIDSPKI